MPEEDSHLSNPSRFQAHQPSLRDENDSPLCLLKVLPGVRTCAPRLTPLKGRDS
jgi:hypothetical protein